MDVLILVDFDSCVWDASSRSKKTFLYRGYQFISYMDVYVRSFMEMLVFLKKTTYLVTLSALQRDFELI